MKKAQFYAELMQYGRTRGFKKGWSAHVYKFRHGCFPESRVADEADSFDGDMSDETEDWLQDYFDEMRREQASKGIRIPKTRIRQLIGLCHPDRHPERPDLANEVTSWLNSLR